MTDHRDPIEDWLSRDIEVLPPPPGAFQQVRRRARRRKVVQAASVAAGVAVIVAAGFSVPALTGNLFPGGGQARVGTPTAGSSSSEGPGPTAGAQYIRGPALPDAARGARPPAGFRPSSITFVGTRRGTLGAVLGTAPCGGHTCTAMAATSTYGSRWTRVGAPPASPSAVRQIRFADPQDGWAFGPQLWATHDGGTSWGRVSSVTGQLIDLATIDNQVLAVSATGCTSPGLAATCTGFALYASTASGSHFRRVLSEPRGGLVTPGSLQLQPTAGAGYLIAGGRLYSGALNGRRWSPVAAGTAAPPCLNGQATGTPAALAPGARVLYAVCATGRRLELYRSASSGRTWQAAGTVAAAGTPTSLAASPAAAGALVLATTAGLYYNSGSSTTWRQVTSGGAGRLEFRFVGMTTARLGVAVPAGSAAGEVFVTTDGGRTWQPRTISP